MPSISDRTLSLVSDSTSLAAASRSHLRSLARELIATHRAVDAGVRSCENSRWLLKHLGQPFKRPCYFCSQDTEHQIRGGQLICLQCFPPSGSADTAVR